MLCQVNVISDQSYEYKKKGETIMKKRFLKPMAALLALSTALSVASCGKKDVAEDGVVEITMWSSTNEDSEPVDKELQAYTDAILAEKFPNIKINKVIKTMGTDYRQEYDKALMAGKAPDFFDQFSYTDIPTRIENGTIADITNIVADWDLKKDDKVITTFDKVINANDKWYAIPRSAYIKSIIANTTALKEAGFDTNKMPRTWDEFKAMGAKVTDKANAKFGHVLMGMDWCAWPFSSWVWSAGGDMVTANGDGTYKLTFTEDPAVDAAMFWNEMIWEEEMTQKNVLSSIDENTTMLANGSGLTMWGSFTDVRIEILEQNGLAMSDFDMFPIPTKDESIAAPALAGGEVITFNPKADEETLKAAFEVATFLYYDEEYLKKTWEIKAKYGVSNIDLPARSDLYLAKLDTCEGISEDAKTRLVEATANAIPEPCPPHWSDLKTLIAKPLQKIMLTEGITRDEAKKLFEDCANELYNLYPEAFKK